MARRVESVAGDLADAVPVDWDRDARASADALFRELRVVAAVGANRRPARATAVGRTWVGWLLDAAVAIALTRVAVAVLVTFGPGSPAFHLGPAGLTVATFSPTACWLLLYGRRDERSRALGALYSLTATAFLFGFLRRANAPFTTLSQIALMLPVESFIGLALWQFASVFPKEPGQTLGRRISLTGLGCSAFTGTLLLLGPVLFPRSPWLWDRTAMSAFWPVVFGVGIPALPFLFWNASSGTRQERSRVLVLAAALIGGSLPILLAGILTPIVPALSRPPLRFIGGILAFGGLASIVPVTVYAVVVQRV